MHLNHNTIFKAPTKEKYRLYCNVTRFMRIIRISTCKFRKYIPASEQRRCYFLVSYCSINYLHSCSLSLFFSPHSDQYYSPTKGVTKWTINLFLMTKFVCKTSMNEKNYLFCQLLLSDYSEHFFKQRLMQVSCRSFYILMLRQYFMSAKCLHNSSL